jgi:heterodisulfide reductase subunit A
VNAVNKHVAVIGAGVAGLTAAEALAGWGVKVSLFEKTPFFGGHAIQLSCKATDACVKCGACLAEEKLRQVTCHDRVEMFPSTQIEAVSGHSPVRIRYQVQSPLVNADHSDASHIGELEADAVVLATGFEPYHPSDKPYGYGRFPNVITSLDAERLLRENYTILRPSDGKPVKRRAFFQCVGSRDARLGHVWCSKICCGSSLRMARLMLSRQTDLAITFFYIDVQTFGKDFQSTIDQVRECISMVRAIPSEIRTTAGDDLEVIYFDPRTGDAREDRFDVVVLSVGLLPSADNPGLARTFDLLLDGNAWLPGFASQDQKMASGIFTAGSASGPMTIAQSIGSAEQTVYAVLRYLDVAASSLGAA